MSKSEKIYLIHNNKIRQILTEDDVALTSAQMAAINKMTLKFGTLIIDSDDIGEGVGQPFDWTTDAASGIVTFDLAEQSIPKGKYRAELIVHSVDNPLGVVWGKIPIRVIDIEYTPIASPSASPSSSPSASPSS